MAGFFIHRLFYVLPNPLNRITAATDNTQRFGLSNVKYDKNGNITHLTRGGHLKEMPDWDKDDDFGTMDQLDYQYFDGSNRLRSVTDGISKNDTSGKGEFVDGNKDGDDYVYDPNGNMTQDLNKGIKGATLAEKGIEYNHLNLPTLVRVNNGADVGTISYIYDASGVKLRKNVLKQGETTPTSTDYAGNYIYENDKLQFFSTPEGYVEPKNPDNLSQGYDYIYQYKDHLGNVRLSYKDNNGTTEILSENNYYPFGLEHKGYNSVVNGRENYYLTYVSKEKNETLGLNVLEMDWRQYDPALGRFNGIDALSEDFKDITPYHYGNNNPIFFSDPSGLFSVVVNDKGEVTDYKSDGDSNIYLGSRSGEIVGQEEEGKEYKKGDKIFNIAGEVDTYFELIVKKQKVQKKLDELFTNLNSINDRILNILQKIDRGEHISTREILFLNSLIYDRDVATLQLQSSVSMIKAIYLSELAHEKQFSMKESLKQGYNTFVNFLVDLIPTRRAIKSVEIPDGSGRTVKSTTLDELKKKLKTSPSNIMGGVKTHGQKLPLNLSDALQKVKRGGE